MSTIAAIQQQTDRASISAILRDAFSSFGFDRFMIAGLPTQGGDVVLDVLLSGWSDEWHGHYQSQGYARVDPVARQCMATTMPFAWAAAPISGLHAQQARQVMNEARDFGMADGFCVPVHAEGGTHGGVSLSGRTEALDSKTQLELHMLALYGHGRLRHLNAQQPAASQHSITAREAEVLKWAANGKTASEIGVITGVTERTVAQHCENAQRRLGTSNRVHTVVEAIRHKLIAL